jgi:hypothetical protein
LSSYPTSKTSKELSPFHSPNTTVQNNVFQEACLLKLQKFNSAFKNYGTLDLVDQVKKGTQEFSTSHGKKQFKYTASNRLQIYGQFFSKVLSTACLFDLLRDA